MVTHNDMIPPVPTLNVLIPPFRALPTPPGSYLLELFAIVALQSNLDETKVAAEKSWCYHDHVALPLFSGQDPNCPQVPIRESIYMEGIKLHAARQ